MTLNNIIGNLSIEPLEGEEFRDISGYDGIYSISNYGRVKSERRERSIGGYIKEKIKKIQYNDDNAQVLLYKHNKPKNFTINQLVATAFIRVIGPNEVAMHINKNFMDNRLKNIEIVSKSHSCKINFNHGLLDNSIRKMADIAIERGNERNTKFGVYEKGVLQAYICTRCFQEKPLKDYLHTNTFCKQCQYIGQGVNDIGKINRRKELLKSGLQECSKCNRTLSLDEFHKTKHTPNGHVPSCKQCYKEMRSNKLKIA